MSHPEDKDFALSLGVARFMEKPIDTEDFLLTVAELVTQQPLTHHIRWIWKDFIPDTVRVLKINCATRIHRSRVLNACCQHLPTDQKPAFEALLQQSMRDRDEIQTELYDIYKTLEELKK